MDILSYHFIQNAILGALLVSISIGIIGTLISINKLSYLAGAIAHASYGGIGIAIFFGFSLLLGGVFFSLILAVILGFLTIDKKNTDTLIGLIWAIGMSIGIIFVDLTPGYQVDLMSYLFGSILSISDNDLFYMSILDTIIIINIILFYRKFLIVSYDIEFAAIRGINIKFYYILMISLSALGIVVAIKVIGLILVISLISISTYLALLISNSLYKMMVNTAIISFILILFGLYLSYIYDISSSATIILSSSIVMIIVLLIKKFKNN